MRCRPRGPKLVVGLVSAVVCAVLSDLHNDRGVLRRLVRRGLAALPRARPGSPAGRGVRELDGPRRSDEERKVRVAYRSSQR